MHQMEDLTKQRDTLHTQLSSFQHVYEQVQQENKSLKEEVNQY
jgi:FtsZ-binding cell division protein ZapB